MNIPNPTTPGVSIEELPKLPNSIALVETAVPVFIGYTERKPSEDNDTSAPDYKPSKISSLLDFEKKFGSAKMESITLKDTDAGITVLEPKAKFLMYYSLQMYFANGGGACYIVSVGDYNAAQVEKSLLESGLNLINNIKEPLLLIFPDAVSLNSPNEFHELYNTTIAKAESAGESKNMFALLDTYYGNFTTKIGNLTAVESFRNTVNSSSYAAAYFPHLKTVLNYHFDEKITPVSHLDTQNQPVGIANGVTLESLKTANSSLYNQIKELLKSLKVVLPPSSAIAGVYGRIDNTRGVWKAPANVSLNYVTAPTEKISDEEQSGLNIDDEGKSINAIRNFTGKGTLIWGARTLDGKDKKEDEKDNEWKYIHVRRYYNMLKQSISIALNEKFINQPHVIHTWLRAKAMIENFLNQQWIDGALAGNSPKEAYKVEVKSGGTDIMDVKIEVALVRPAEFIVLNFSHKL